MIGVNNNIFKFNSLETMCNYLGENYSVVQTFETKKDCAGYELLKSDCGLAYKCLRCGEILLGEPRLEEVLFMGVKVKNYYCNGCGAKLYEI